MQTLSGSMKNSKRILTPFEKAENNVNQFLMNMHASYSFDSLAERIILINSMLAMPIMSSSSGTVQSSRVAYNKELFEIEQAIKLYVAMSDIPEA